ncbi:ankyrin repeat domain-containing protein 49 [Platysternon megacephalum]|uniref:Ankyrin repeat domain-containing protein 49 n=1 Tax=Platysternon megacephalum TaxID=55544 RepID=A0A4D9E1U5_9SAUR|nr:ankyrin repeat domain-containing protein 49 [Platysternon megacephalum]
MNSQELPRALQCLHHDCSEYFTCKDSLTCPLDTSPLFQQGFVGTQELLAQNGHGALLAQHPDGPAPFQEGASPWGRQMWDDLPQGLLPLSPLELEVPQALKQVDPCQDGWAQTLSCTEICPE